MAQICIGTSGWTYPHWRGTFYPSDIVQQDWLHYYAARLAGVEINASFYRLPEPGTLQTWAREVPEGFRFAFKASRYLTHMKKLKPAEEGLGLMLERAKMLGHRLGPILFQLPPHWQVNAARLDEFLSHLPRRLRYAFEFRDPSWWDDTVYTLLQRYGAAAVWFDLQGNRSPQLNTAPFRYVRWHGPAAAAYSGRYGRNRLRPLASAILRWQAAGQDVYVFFDNDQAAYAPQDALALQVMVEELELPDAGKQPSRRC